METLQLDQQSWAFTNPKNNVCNMDLERGYYNYECNESMDAPDYIATGSTIENIATIGGNITRCIIGGIVGRR